MKLVIPVKKFEKEDSAIFPHFGRAPQFVLVGLRDDGSVESMLPMDNVGEHFGGHGAAEKLVSDLEPDALVVKGMGPRGLQAFQSKGIAVFTGDVNTVKDAIGAYLVED